MNFEEIELIYYNSKYLFIYNIKNRAFYCVSLSKNEIEAF